MKIIYSSLQELLPQLDRSPQDLADDLTLIGHFAAGIEQVEKETVLDLEIRQNRGDCFGYWGVAKDLATLYNIPLQQEKFHLENPTDKKKLPIEIAAPDKVKRLMAIKLSNIKNKSAPAKIKSFLARHEVNSVNCLVDLTNYIMLWHGIPNHAFDAQKSGSALSWQINQGKFKQFTSFDGGKISLKPGVLQVANAKKVTSLAGIVGGKKTGVTLSTKESLVEMAIYDATQIRHDAQTLNIQTEASRRLEKELDCNLIPPAFNHLIKLIREHTGAQLDSQIFDYYPKKRSLPKINLPHRAVQQYAGIKISPEFTKKNLENLGCHVKEKEESWQVTPPSWRFDLNLKEDLVEEVIRFYGYDKIPTDQPLNAKILPSITPDILHLIEAVKFALTGCSYDEIRSWPLIKEKNLIKASLLPKKSRPIYTQNSINENYPVLRQSMLSSLKKQAQAWQKLKIPQQRFFEVGKIFWQEDDQYKEVYSLGIFNKLKRGLKKDLKRFFRLLQLPDQSPKITPCLTGWACELQLANLLEKMPNIPKIASAWPSPKAKNVIELDRQLIILDANVISQNDDPFALLHHFQAKIPSQYLWQLEMVDIYQENQDVKYTMRAYYFNCSAQKAKEIHRKTFELNP